MFSLSALTMLAADYDETSVTLSPESVALVFACYGVLADMGNWVGASFELTDAERDEIDAMVGALYAEMSP